MVITSTYSRAIVHLTIPIIPIHVHFWLYELLFSLDPELTLQYMWCKYALSFLPTLSSTYSHH
jgi:hypothetical protein